MADIQYLNYGDLQIELLALLNALADNVQDYVAKQSWSNKRKLKFMSAYSDIMNKGILGASNNTGQWMLDIGDNIDIASKDKKDQEMYGEAAYFIQQQMASLPTKATEKEEEKKDLPLFDNKYFTENFISLIGRDRFGGQDWAVSKWNELDARGKDGIRGTDNRAKALANYLKSYSNSLKEGEHNFEGSPFTNLDDFKSRVNDAITELENGTWNLADKDALNRIGLNPDKWLNNGSGDPSKTINPETGIPFTYAELALHNKLQAELKAKLDAETAKAKLRAAYNNTLFITRGSSKLQGQSLQALKTKYGAYDKLQQALFQYSLKDIRKLTPDELSEIHGAYRYLAKEPIDGKLLKQLQSSSGGRYVGASPNRFKKISGIDNLIWDSAARQVIQILSRQLYNANNSLSLDLFAGILTQLEKNLQYMSSPRGGGIQLTDADKRDIYATLADLGAVINPEVFTGTALALSASGARTWNSIELKGLWDTLTDWKTWADWGTGALGGTMLLGDTSSTVKFVRGLGKVMTLPAIVNALYNMPEAKAAWDKIDLNNPIESVKKLTPLDYHALSSFLVGVLSGKNYIKGNLAERKVLQESGFNTLAKTKRREYANKFGITRTKPTNQSKQTETPTLKIKKTGEDGKVEEKIIHINEEQKAALQNTKPDKLNERAKELLGDKIPEGFKVETNSSSWNSVKTRFGRGNSEIFGKTSTSSILETPRLDNFLNWLNNRSIWDLYKPWSLGTNSNLRRVRNNIFGKDFDKSELVSSASGEESSYAKKPLEQGEIKKSNHIEGLPDKTNKEEILIRRDIMNDYRKTIKEGKFSSKDMEGGKESIKIGNEDVRVYTTKHADGSPSITITTSKGNRSFRSLEEAKKFIASLVKELKNNITSGKITKENIKEIGKVLLELKKKGWLKKGGRIDKQRIQKYKEFIKK